MPKHVMVPAVYKHIAAIINSSGDDEFRTRMANHFATEFRKRNQRFDPVQWEQLTGGKIQGFNIHTGKFE